MNQKTIHKIFVFLTITSFIFISCNNGVYYEKFEKVNVSNWNYKDSIFFKIPVEDTKKKKLFVNLRNTADYEKANLWLFITLLSPSGERIKDTIDCPLADDYGYWLGSGFSGLYLSEHLLNKEIHFDKKGEWSISITHGMRAESIKGIQEVGILVKEIAQK